jgi:type 1 glutamine amidotransferase
MVSMAEAPKLAGVAMARYVAWIKPCGKGRGFYGSPSRFPENYETSTLSRFLLDGVQYESGDLKCDNSVMAKNAALPEGWRMLGANLPGPAKLQARHPPHAAQSLMWLAG